MKNMSTTPSSWATEAWEWGIEHGLVNGPDAKHPSDPKATVTKQELIVILKRYHERLNK